jgi:hypothetical protein
MAKLSYGDLSINSLVPSNDASTSVEEMLNNIERSFPTEENIKKDTSIKNAIPINKNQDGSLKYTFDNIYEDKELAEVAKDYYTNRDEQTYSNKEAVDKFISDRTWNQANSITMAKEFSYITGENAGDDQKGRLAYLTKYWDNLPNFYEEGGRGMKGFFKNLGVGILDPINIIGAGVGGQVAKQVLTKGAQQVVKSQIKKGVAKKTVAKEILNSPEEFAKLATKTKKEALIKGSASMALVDGAGFGTIDIANQTVEKEIGLRETLDPVRTGTIALTAGGLGFFVGVGGGYVGNAIRNLRLAKNTDLPTKNLKKAAKDAPDNTGKSEGLNNDLKTGSYIRTNLVDQWDFVKVLQKEITGVGGDVSSLKKIYKSGKYKSDPILEPYFQLRTLAASSTRAHNFIMSGVMMPPKAGTRSASYTQGKSKGLHEILKQFDDNNEANDFLQYVSAKRHVALAKRGKKIDASLPMAKNVRKEFIDFAEMSPLQFAKKYKTSKARKSNFVKGLADYKKFTDDLMEYQVRSGLVSEAEAKTILKANPYFIPLTRDKLADTGTGVVSAIKQQTQKVFGLSRPGSVALATTKQTGDINLYQNLITYANKTVMSGDRNRAKLAFYEMLQKGDKLNKFKIDDIAARVKKNDKRLVRFQNVATENVEKAYKNAGAKVTVKNKPDRLDILTFSNTFRESKDAPIIDIVYRNGKQEMYEIKNPNLAEIFKGLGESGANRLFNMFSETGIFSRYARIAAQAITYSPPFVAFNIIRDTLAGTINSAFGIGSRALPNKVGYIPGFTTVKGYIGAVRQTQTFKEAMINGMGYSSRVETEALQPKNISKMIEQGSRLNVDTRLTNYYSNYLSKFKNIATAGGKQYKKLVQSAEYATRMGEYQLAKSAGFSEIGAAFAGREVATDFGMRGSNAFLNAINRNTMFLNASLQGLYRTSRVFFEQPSRALAMVTATIVSPSIALYHMNSQHPEYSKVPNQVKQLNYLIPNYTTDENGNQVLDKELPFYLIPKPYDLGIFANIAEGLIDGMYKNSSGVVKQYVAESWSQITPGLPIPTAFRPFIEMMVNKNLYSGAPVIGIYELQRLDELQARGTTRDIAESISKFTGNLSSFLMRRKEGTVDTPIFTPIEVDYLLGAYLTGMMQYPVDILNAVNIPFTDKKLFGKDKPLEGEKISKREDEADLTSFKNAYSIVTRRFKLAAPIKNSQYHKEWRELISKAKKLKQIDVTQMDLNKVHSSRLIGLFGRIEDKLDEGKQFGLEEEVIAFSKISDILKSTQQQLIESQRERNNIINGPFSADRKRELTDTLIKLENELLKITIDYLADMDIEFIFDKTFGLKSLVLGTAENAVKTNPLEKKN